MADVRPLKELLSDLVGSADTHADGPAAYLAEHGHDLPPDLVAEAVVSYADTAPPEVAEHLAPFVTAHTSGLEPESDWFDLLTSAPDPADDLDAEPDVDALHDPHDSGPDDLDGDLDADDGTDPEHDLGFGSGHHMDFGTGSVDALDLPPAHHDPVPDLVPDPASDSMPEPDWPEPSDAESSAEPDDSPEDDDEDDDLDD